MQDLPENHFGEWSFMGRYYDLLWFFVSRLTGSKLLQRSRVDGSCFHVSFKTSDYSQQGENGRNGKYLFDPVTDRPTHPPQQQTLFQYGA